MFEMVWIYALATLGSIGLTGAMMTMAGLQELEFKIILVGFLLAAFGLGGAMLCNDQRPFDATPALSWDTVETQNISSLNGETSFDIDGGGSFILGSGSIVINGNTKQIYTFFKVLPDGYQKGTLDADNVIVTEDEQIYPYIEWKYSHATTEGKVYSDHPFASTYSYKVDKLMSTYIHVPKGTIVKEFKV